ncbi:MBL fold metallo-hydrolase [Orenia marismortui]|uniref:Phosphoribosyl 1,2-cyclic phosphodiesterase n=1 Tax=Orenia marismortui TaxID=46469 RepID=A0A4R8GUA2_9FIRM|nr:MBL fold metallo-hydrolase [Orenia marismortui]TDX48465.1 phosphoribosyl 1,2-cyclic phosphodiesterase [Orenia marismortui]
MILISLEVCTLASGSSGNAIYIGSKNNKILVDAGLSGKRINNKLKEINLNVNELDAILITHEHNDHIQGAGVLSRRCDLPIYASKGTWEEAESKLGNIADKNKFIIDTNGFDIGDCYINPFNISHDAKEPVGYAITSEKAKVAIATDMGEITQEVKSQIIDSDLVVLESNHDLEMLKIGPYPWSLKKRVMGVKGHLSNDDAGAAVVELAQNAVSRILLAHLSKDNNVPELAYLTIKNMLIDAGIKLDKDIKLGFALQDKVSPLYQVG